MKQKNAITFTGLIISFVFTTQNLPSQAQVKKTRNCSMQAVANINEAVQFMRDNVQTLKHDFKLAPRKLRRRRIRRRIDRKINKLKFGCAERVLCREDAPRVALHAFGIASTKIRLCYDKMLSQNFDFCNFTGIVAHEFGHAVGIPKKRLGQHSQDQDDRVYRFGWFVEDLCINQGRNRSLE